MMHMQVRVNSLLWKIILLQNLKLFCDQTYSTLHIAFCTTTIAIMDSRLYEILPSYSVFLNSTYNFLRSV